MSETNKQQIDCIVNNICTSVFITQSIRPKQCQAEPNSNSHIHIRYTFTYILDKQDLLLSETVNKSNFNYLVFSKPYIISIYVPTRI